jgi:hypothetical protein
MDNILSITGSQVSIYFLKDKRPLQEAGLEKSGHSNLVVVFLLGRFFLDGVCPSFSYVLSTAKTRTPAP